MYNFSYCSMITIIKDYNTTLIRMHRSFVFEKAFHMIKFDLFMKNVVSVSFLSAMGMGFYLLSLPVEMVETYANTHDILLIKL